MWNSAGCGDKIYCLGVFKCFLSLLEWDIGKSAENDRMGGGSTYYGRKQLIIFGKEWFYDEAKKVDIPI